VVRSIFRTRCSSSCFLAFPFRHQPWNLSWPLVFHLLALIPSPEFRSGFQIKYLSSFSSTNSIPLILYPPPSVFFFLFGIFLFILSLISFFPPDAVHELATTTPSPHPRFFTYGLAPLLLPLPARASNRFSPACHPPPLPFGSQRQLPLKYESVPRAYLSKKSFRSPPSRFSPFVKKKTNISRFLQSFSPVTHPLISSPLILSPGFLKRPIRQVAFQLSFPQVSPF